MKNDKICYLCKNFFEDEELLDNFEVIQGETMHRTCMENIKNIQSSRDFKAQELPF